MSTVALPHDLVRAADTLAVLAEAYNIPLSLVLIKYGEKDVATKVIASHNAAVPVDKMHFVLDSVRELLLSYTQLEEFSQSVVDDAHYERILKDVVGWSNAVHEAQLKRKDSDNFHAGYEWSKKENELCNQ